MTAATSSRNEWLQFIVLLGGAVAVLGGWIGFLVRRILHWLDDHIASAVRELRDALLAEQRELATWRDFTTQQLGVVGDRLDHIESRLDDHLEHHTRIEGDGR